VAPLNLAELSLKSIKKCRIVGCMSYASPHAGVNAGVNVEDNKTKPGLVYGVYYPLFKDKAHKTAPPRGGPRLITL
jgi:hypothetical protein